jgi:hypothetical protein
MRPVGLVAMVIALALCGCVDSLQSEQPPNKWTTGFWFWSGSSAASAATSDPLDVVFFHAGTIRKESGRYATAAWSAYGHIPDELPAAREYWAVFRYERQSVPDLPAALILAKSVSQLRQAARQRRLNFAGVQLDIDSPTSALSQYAGFLREIRKDLPPGVEISITALLDWFRDGTAIGAVINEVDEFVPQFYDISGPDNFSGGSAIAAKFHGAEWAPRFNRLKKRFRVGISVFGRARALPKENQGRPAYARVLYRDLTPLDIAINPAFILQTTRNEANELVLTYRATRTARIDDNQFAAGDAVQFVLATPETVRDAVENARQMRGYSAGVVFFRWPGEGETLVLQPTEVLTAAGLRSDLQLTPTRISLVDGACVAVRCVDVYLISSNPLSPKPARYRIRSSTELEYFLPEDGVPVRMTGPDLLELSLPPYCGRGHTYLGRAVTATRAEFSIEEE